MRRNPEPVDIPNVSASLFLSEQNKPRKSGFDRKGVAKGIVEIWLWETQMESREFIGPGSQLYDVYNYGKFALSSLLLSAIY